MSKKKHKHYSSGAAIYSYRKYRPPCHNGSTEVVPGLFCGAEDDILDSLKAGVDFDVLVPLNRLGGEVWRTGFRGEILYYPIDDYSVLPDDVLHDLTSKIVNRLRKKQKVGLFCLGGHGRTGYVAAIVLGRLGYSDPIGYLREKYCDEAVESSAQVKHIAKITKHPELEDKYAISSWDRYSVYGYGFYDKYVHVTTPAKAETEQVEKKEDEPDKCWKCAYYMSGKCMLLDVQVQYNNSVCFDFINADEIGG